MLEGSRCYAVKWSGTSTGFLTYFIGRRRYMGQMIHTVLVTIRSYQYYENRMRMRQVFVIKGRCYSRQFVASNFTRAGVIVGNLPILEPRGNVTARTASERCGMKQIIPKVLELQDHVMFVEEKRRSITFSCWVCRKGS
jgi:hypothetical protein